MLQRFGPDAAHDIRRPFVVIAIECASLIETAKAEGMEPYAYLRTEFSALPQANSVDENEALLPLPDDGIDSARVS